MDKSMKTENEQKKEYLWRYRRHGRKIERITAEIEEVRRMKMNPALNDDGMPHGSGQSDLSDYASELCDLEEQAYQEGIEQLRVYKEASWKIKQLEDENERDVLFYRYIKGLGWWEIAEKMGYTERWVTELHGRALKHLKL